MFDDCLTLVFKEIEIANDLYFQWYRLGTEEDDELIVPLDCVYSEEEHWQRFNNICS